MNAAERATLDLDSLEWLNARERNAIADRLELELYGRLGTGTTDRGTQGNAGSSVSIEDRSPEG